MPEGVRGNTDSCNPGLLTVLMDIFLKGPDI